MIAFQNDGFSNRAKILVVGTGDGGSSAVKRMRSAGVSGISLAALNTNASGIVTVDGIEGFCIGRTITNGQGAGGRAAIGRAAAEESREAITEMLDGYDMVFVTAGMGGGTGTGSAPVVAEIAQSLGILTIAIVTTPFQFEGPVRRRSALEGLAELEKYTDSLLVVDNQRLFTVVNRDTSLAEAFAYADSVLCGAVRGITDLVTTYGLVQVDFADLKTVMLKSGRAVIGSAVAEGDDRALCAAEQAMTNPLLGDVSLSGSTGLILNITGGSDLTMFDVSVAAERVQAAVGDDADTNVILGAVINPEMTGKLQVTLIATGFARVKSEPKRDPITAAAAGHFPPPQKLTIVDVAPAQLILPGISVLKEQVKPVCESVKTEEKSEVVDAKKETKRIPIVTPAVDDISGFNAYRANRAVEMVLTDEEREIPAFLRNQVRKWDE